MAKQIKWKENDCHYCHGVKCVFECESAWSSNYFTFERARVHIGIGTLTTSKTFSFFSVF